MASPIVLVAAIQSLRPIEQCWIERKRRNKVYAAWEDKNADDEDMKAPATMAKDTAMYRSAFLCVLEPGGYTALLATPMATC